MNISMREFVTSVVACWAVCGVACSPANADEIPRRLSPHAFETSGWDFIPAYTESTNTVSAIVALAKPGTTVGDNLHTVLFMRTPTGWDAYSWLAASPLNALYTSKFILNIPDEDNDLFKRPELVELFNEDAARPPLPYLAGMLTNDPLFGVVQNSATPQALIDMLVSIGYPAAALRPTEGGGEIPGCPEEMMMLSSMADTIDWAGAGMYAPEAQIEALTVGMSVNLTACVDPEPEPTCEPGQITPWSTSLSPGECKWVLTGIRSEPRIDNNWRWSCIYEQRKYFIEYRSAKFKKADCTEVTCTQRRTGYASGDVIYCMITKPDPTPTPTCSPTATCPRPDPPVINVCAVKYGTQWDEWQNFPPGPCP